MSLVVPSQPAQARTVDWAWSPNDARWAVAGAFLEKERSLSESSVFVGIDVAEATLQIAAVLPRKDGKRRMTRKG